VEEVTVSKHVGRLWIEGVAYDSIHHAFRWAQHSGFTGSESTFAERLRTGADAWVKLLKPVDTNSFVAARTAKVQKRSRDAAEMADMCRRLDERKRLIEGAA
jgi:hypothetical protein